jgi:CxxC motif-containing protein
MTRTFTYLCIGCPLGCRLELDEDDQGQIVEIRGSSCRRGDRYAAQEHTDPRRQVTTTVALSGGRLSRLPVKTDAEIPKDLVLEACRALDDVRVSAPVRIGDVVVEDLLGTGCAVVATSEAPAVP